MRFRNLTAGLVAAALVYTPAPAFAQAAPEPAPTVESGVALAHDGTEHRNRRRTTLVVVAAFIALAFGALLLFSESGGEEAPTSP